MNIVIARPRDLPLILILQKECYLVEVEIYNDYNILPLFQTIESITNDLKKQTFFKIEFNKKVVGTVRGYMDGENCHIGYLFVHIDHQNAGLGKKLMKTIENYFSEAKRFEVYAGHKSFKNLILYKNMGYKEFKRKKLSKNMELIYLEKKTNVSRS